MEKFISNSVEETEAIAQKIAKITPLSTVIELIGDLGAGKTAFSKGFAKGLGITATITSPTFVLLNTYEGDGVELNHFDLYRIEDEEELDLMGFQEIFYNKNAMYLVEWPQIAEKMLPQNRYVITINKIDDNSREIVLEKK